MHTHTHNRTHTHTHTHTTAASLVGMSIGFLIAGRAVDTIGRRKGTVMGEMTMLVFGTLQVIMSSGYYISLLWSSAHITHTRHTHKRTHIHTLNTRSYTHTHTRAHSQPRQQRR